MFVDAILDRIDDLPRLSTNRKLGILLCLLISNLAFDGATDADAAASVEFTSVPPYGSPNNLLGKVHGGSPASNRIAVLIYMDGLGWWTKPTCADPLTTIQPEG